MPEKINITRRIFLKRTALTGTSLLLTRMEHTLASNAKAQSFLFGGFTKTLQHLGLNYEETAEAIADIGWNGIECPVRPQGHVLPERVEDDLPLMVEALKKRDMTVLVMATDIHTVDEPYTEQILRTASKLGIKYYRLGWWRYRDGISIPDQLKEIKPRLRDLAALNRELGICGVYQNHSGTDMVGAPVWDVYELIRELDPRYIASNFDIGHATVEGGYCWPIQFRLIQPLIGAVLVKDFTWTHTPGKGGVVRWCPLGEGMVSSEFFVMLKKSGYRGPVIQHFEYEVESTTRQEQVKKRIMAMKRDFHTLKKLLEFA